MGGAFVLQFIMTFFFMPETAFKRSSSLNIDTSAHNVSQSPGELFTMLTQCCRYRSVKPNNLHTLNSSRRVETRLSRLLQPRLPKKRSRSQRKCFHTLATSTASRSGKRFRTPSNYSRLRPSCGQLCCSPHVSRGWSEFPSLSLRSFPPHRTTSPWCLLGPRMCPHSWHRFSAPLSLARQSMVWQN